LGIAFLTGGGARPDIQSLMMLRPLAVLLCGYACWTLTGEQIRKYRVLFAFMLAIFVLVGAQLVPLPPSFWRNMPGREIVTEIDGLAGLGDVWRPMSLTPGATWNAFYSLFVPLAALLLMVQLRRSERGQLLPILIGVGLLSALMGVFQVIGGDDSSFYFYQITNSGSAVGLFANRNHAAVFLACMFPMLAVFASTNARTIEQARFRTWAAVVACLFIVPLILVTGSRGGLLTGLVGLVSIPLLYHQPVVANPPKRKAARFNPVYLVGTLGTVCLGLLTILLARAQAFDRLLAFDQKEEARFLMWRPIAAMAYKYFPFGSGFGSFEQVYQLDEPSAQLRTTYVNHAHNDVLEVYLTGGAGAVALLALGVALWAYSSWSVWTDRRKANSSGIDYARLGSVLLLILGLASVADYPLRVPSIACFAIVAAIWLRDAAETRSASPVVGAKGDGSDRNSVLLHPQSS